MSQTTAHREFCETTDSRPALWRDSSFWGLSTTQFLGAFNDNLFKQVLLLFFVAVPVAGDAAARSTVDRQWLATLLFALPFILFSGFAGYLADRNSKRRVIVLSKVAEIAVMAAGLTIFVFFTAELADWSAVRQAVVQQQPVDGLLTPRLLAAAPAIVTTLSVVLFFMGAQSAFFGPGKYGILPELLRGRDLPSANGFVLMTTFLAIILGTVLAGQLMHSFPHKLWIIGLACVSIAFVGTMTSTSLRRVRPARPDLQLSSSALAVPGDIWRLFGKDRALLIAVFASCLFWLSAAMVQMAVNSLGKRQLGLDDRLTSLMAAAISVGIAIGSVLAGILSKDRFNATVMKSGAWGMTFCLFLLSLPGGEHSHLLGFTGSLPVLVLLGTFTGMFAVPLQVFLQTRPPKELKGRMIATQNLLNWIGIALSAGLYLVVNLFLDAWGRPRSGMFAFTGSLVLLVAVFYRPKDEAL